MIFYLNKLKFNINIYFNYLLVNGKKIMKIYKDTLLRGISPIQYFYMLINLVQHFGYINIIGLNFVFKVYVDCNNSNILYGPPQTSRVIINLVIP